MTPAQGSGGKHPATQVPPMHVWVPEHVTPAHGSDWVTHVARQVPPVMPPQRSAGAAVHGSGWQKPPTHASPVGHVSDVLHGTREGPASRPTPEPSGPPPPPSKTPLPSIPPPSAAAPHVPPTQACPAGQSEVVVQGPWVSSPPLQPVITITRIDRMLRRRTCYLRPPSTSEPPTTSTGYRSRGRIG